MEVGAQKRFIIWLYGSSLFIRLSLFFYYTCHGRNAWVYVDSDQYHQLALSFLHNGQLLLQPEGLMSYRLPGYPLFLSFWYWLAGVNQNVPLLVQIMFASCIPCFLYVLSLRLFPASVRAARCVGWLACFHVGFVLYAGMLATETFFIFFFLLFLLSFLPAFVLKKEVYVTSKTRSFFVAGIYLGFASMFRPLGLYLLALSFVLLLFSTYVFGQKIKACGVLCGGWLMIVLPWLIRNTLLFGVPFFHTLPGLHFLQYPAARVTGMAEHVSYPDAREKVLTCWQHAIEKNEAETGITLNEYGRCCVGEKCAFRVLYAHPFYVVKDASCELFKTVFGLYSAIILLGDDMPWPEYTERTSWQTKIKRFLTPAVKRPLLVAVIYWDIFMLLFMLFGFCLFLFRIIRRKNVYDIFWKIMPFIILLIGVTSAYGGARLRMPADLLLLLGAVYGLLPVGDKQ